MIPLISAEILRIGIILSYRFWRYLALMAIVYLLKGRCRTETLVFLRSVIVQCIIKAKRSTRKFAVILNGPITAKSTHCMNLSDLWTRYDFEYMKIMTVLWKNIFTNESGSNTAVYAA